ncbi:MAG: DUF6259 domain-containing protein [Firmicutes bacterium]|jgi:hypothetical protein|nr:DUF6259 domain-containing protein [Bacillota bacterium]MDH7494769.1 DUF6259 domain-containing protein [Bacillota bacterium]
MAWYNREAIDFELDPGSGAIARFAVNERPLLAKPAVEGETPLLEVVLVMGERKIRVRPHTVHVRPHHGSMNGACGMRAAEVEFVQCAEVQELPGARQDVPEVDLEEAAERSAQLYQVTGRCLLDIEDDGTFIWRLSLENKTGLPVHEILFPCLGPVRLPGTADLLYPHHAGEKIRDVPASLASERYLRFWRAQSVPTPCGYAREINYCGLASMTWMDLTDGVIGLYAASYDPSFPVTGLRVETGGPEDPWVTLGFRKYVDVEPGGLHETGPVVWRVHSGDWHEAAREYRRWFDGLVEQREQPEDLRREVVITTHYQFRRYEGIAHRFEDIPRLFDRDKSEFQSRHFFIASWNHLGFDSHYPDYNPDLELGTPLKLYEGVRYVRDSGGFATFYINSRIMDRHSEYLPSLGQRWLLRNERGEPISETYGPAEAVVLCPSCSEWRSYLEEFAVWMCQAYGARGIYFDQLGSAMPLPCYASHAHSPVRGSWGFNAAYVDLIERTTGRLRALRPDAFLMIENCGDIYSSRVFANVAWNGERYDEFFNLYKFTFPEHILINMVNPRNVKDPALQEEMFYRDLDRAFVLGSVFWIEPDHFDDRVTDDELRSRMVGSLKRAIRVREATAPYLAHAVFMDDLELEVPAGLKATRWESAGKNAGGLLLVVNRERLSDLVITLSRDAWTSGGDSGYGRPGGGGRLEVAEPVTPPFGTRPETRRADAEGTDAAGSEVWRLDSETCEWRRDSARVVGDARLFSIPSAEYSVFRWGFDGKEEA